MRPVEGCPECPGYPDGVCTRHLLARLPDVLAEDRAFAKNHDACAGVLRALHLWSLRPDAFEDAGLSALLDLVERAREALREYDGLG